MCESFLDFEKPERTGGAAASNARTSGSSSRVQEGRGAVTSNPERPAERSARHQSVPLRQRNPQFGAQSCRRGRGEIIGQRAKARSSLYNCVRRVQLKNQSVAANRSLIITKTKVQGYQTEKQVDQVCKNGRGVDEVKSSGSRLRNQPT